MKMKKRLIIGGTLIVLALSGCLPGGGTPTPTPTPDLTPPISITGELVPEQRAQLSVRIGGRVEEVLVDEGDPVAQGEVVLRLDATDLRLAVQQAEAQLESARAELAAMKADPLAEEIRSAEAAIERAEAALSQAIAQRNQLAQGQADSDIVQAQVRLAEAEAAHRSTLITHDRMYANSEQYEDWELDEITVRLRAAEQAVEAAEMGLSYARASAAARIRAAAAGVAAAEAQRDVAQARLVLLEVGAQTEAIAVAEASVQQAQVELDAAQVMLDRYELRAPFTGTVGNLDVRIGEYVAPGMPLISLGDLSTMRVETTDLVESDVPRVELGQRVMVSFDALPEQTFTGEVVHIDPMPQPGSGGVNYRAIVELETLPAAVRWGMTAFVDVEVTDG